ncbi:MAG TPA: hypothetical protein VGO58_01905 [Chitinophagaceae bacterium]|jgi:hypothetical protein|nr:hypothetical protein [Chitinophagaceae bacterium]
MANYRWSISESDKPETLEQGSIRKEMIMETFDQFPWMDRVQKMADMKEEEIYFAPSLEFENLDTTHAVCISIIGDASKYEFYTFYRRPKTFKILGLFKKKLDKHLSEITGQTKEDAARLLKVFIDNNYELMEKMMKKK